MANYQMVSYKEYKQFLANQALQNEMRQKGETPDNSTQAEPVEVETRPWLDCRNQGIVLMQLWLTSKHGSSLQYEVQVQNSSSEANVKLPTTMISETVFGYSKKAVAHFMKIDPEKPFGGKFTITVQNNWKPNEQLPSANNQVVTYTATAVGGGDDDLYDEAGGSNEAVDATGYQNQDSWSNGNDNE